MNITSVSLSYMFFVVSIIEFIFFLYYKFLVINTGAKSKRRENIIGTMKNPEHWRKRNNIIAFISLFWSLISIFAFIYLKFFYATHLLSIVYVFIYIAAIVLSVFVFIKKNKIVTKK
ncbi:hypothetical protein E4V42_15305 [Clostridium estertheticum]|uniref:DUF3784 domain-containing protein n=1 Tax=Clostridium estertheticum TaxID=238834 RepID=A0A5N7IR73_9CLOT|nr:hypothetical protein [Clostridium estertheticum]MPQ32797.1 hypothetical protein [Clostridium estertheticum]MPQ63456.1 hypothetical protein [Clostridium estertheticum]